MSNIKEEAIKLIKQMSDECSLEDIMYELYFKQKVEKGLKELDEDRVLEHDSAKKRLGKWLKSSGR